MTIAGGRRRILTVSELAQVLQQALDQTFRDVWVAGELSNVHQAASGHVYFVLKDDAAQVAGVAFRGVATRLGFRLEDGLHVVVGGRLGLYAVRGALQLYADRIEPMGAGALALAFEQLKAGLDAEGLFATARKRPLPRFPEVVGVVTSAEGAAIRDVCRILGDRWPAARVVVQGTAVQGAEAGPAVARALGVIGRRGDVDVVIVCRGGGSLEDLWAFNTEVVARAIAVSPVPVISGVGHESDVTIADLVADVRAPTPTAAAALAVPDRREVGAAIRDRATRLAAALRRRVGVDRMRLTAVRRGLASPKRRIEETMVRLDDLGGRLRAALGRRVAWERRGLAALAGKLDVLSPLASLARGYAIVRRPDSGLVVTDAAALAVGDALDVLLARGGARVRVERREG